MDRVRKIRFRDKRTELQRLADLEKRLDTIEAKIDEILQALANQNVPVIYTQPVVPPDCYVSEDHSYDNSPEVYYNAPQFHEGFQNCEYPGDQEISHRGAWLASGWVSLSGGVGQRGGRNIHRKIYD